MMPADLTADLAPEQRLALSYAGARDRALFAAVFALDRQVSRAAMRSGEPIAAQLRLAWWREQVADAGAPVAEPILVSLRKEWVGDRAPLVAMVDAWEMVLGEHPEIAAVAAGRAEPFGAIAAQIGYDCAVQADARMAACLWALADLLAHDPALDRGAAKTALARLGGLQTMTLPRALRPLAVLGGLAQRALRRGGPLLGDRASPLVAVRLGIFGR